MSEYSDIWYHSEDGLKLYARDYPCADPAVAQPGLVLCMHGLTRNSADFAGLAPHLSQRYRVVAVDVRGRGRSEYDSNPANYTPLTYARDMLHLLDQLDVPQAVLCGTSMGGLMALLMTAMAPARVRAIILNDIGPEIDPRGLERIKNYVGKAQPVIDWAGAVAQSRGINGEAFPDFTDADWLHFARAVYREEHGVPVLAYDQAIAQPVDADDGAAIPADLWPVFDAAAAHPMLVVRGALSDILAASCVATMQRRKPDLQYAELSNRGHAPTLDEPAARAAIDTFLASLDP
ncbi:alpha/beta fold hydrolase [Haliea sp. E17]|uniref:alpha/beta fold hydrolase n=1 Tax=Haliea sp. E17 TaxID=3401576 RepID=UPI003AADC8D4